MLTSHPEKWQHEITITDVNQNLIKGNIQKISNFSEDIIPKKDLVLLCLLGFLIEQTLLKIKPLLSKNCIVASIVSSTGFFFFAHKILGNEWPLFGFQRVPFIARVNVYGHSANLLGYKSALNIAVENTIDKEHVRVLVEFLFSTPTQLLGSFYEACLTNSNPILHTSRLYSMWHNWNGSPYNKSVLFYKEWTENAAQLLINMDNEFKQLLEKLPMNSKAVPSLLEYYESTDAKTLSQKLKSIKAFETIKAPMLETPNGWLPDFKSRYFTEDFPYGLKFIVDLAKEYNVNCPNIKLVYNWGMSVINS